MNSVFAPAGSTLFHIASQYLGDAAFWTRLAAINRTSDPFISTSTVILIPVPRAGAATLPQTSKLLP
jgi:nucleoid-associated protein YgaU